MPFNGTEPTWDESFWNALGGNGVAARLGSGLAGDWGLNFIGAAISPGSYAKYGQVTVPGWVNYVSQGAGLVATAAFTIASGGAYGAYAAGAGAAVGGGIGAGYAYAKSQDVLSGAFSGATIGVGVAGIAAGGITAFRSTGASLACRMGSAAIGAAGGAVAGAGIGGGVGFTTGLIQSGSIDIAWAAAKDGAVQGALWGAAGGAVAGFSDPFICFVAGTQVVVGVEDEEGRDALLELNANSAESTESSVATATRVRYVTKSIEQLVAIGGGESGDGGGQSVLARDQHDADGPLVKRRVSRTYKRTAYALQHLTLRDDDGVEQTLQVTEEHPFHVTSRGWTKARLLQTGDVLTGAVSALTIIDNIHELHPEGVTVFNLEVEQAHTYFVRADGAEAEAVWAHNASNSYAFANRGNGGRGGSQTHADIQDNIYRTAGGDEEVAIAGSGRYADNVDSQGRIHQIGDMRFRGGFRPDAMERAAIEDIRAAVGSGRDIIYHDRLGLSPSLINPDMFADWRRAPLQYRKNI